MAKITLEHNAQEKWSRSFTAREVKILQHFYATPIDQFTAWLDGVVDREIKRMKREMVLDGIGADKIDDDTAIDSYTADPEYKSAADRAGI